MRTKIFSFVVLVALAAGSIPVSAQSDSSEVAGLGSSVTVRRDSRFIPYIEASNVRDLYFAQGYETARDRLWQMELLRRVARGELAELFGERVLEDDKRWRRFGFAEIARKSVPTLSNELKDALQAYASGVNAYIESLTDESMPIEFKVLRFKPRNWSPEDTVIVGKILSDALSTTWQFDVAREAIEKLPSDKKKDLLSNVTPYDVILFGDDRKEDALPGIKSLAGLDLDALTEMAAREETARRNSLELVGLFAEDLAASNNWVVSGKLTVDGRPMLANDPHLQPNAPGIWHMVHLSATGMKVAGVTFPGVPGVVLGHNEDIAWGATNVGPDVQDLYREEFNDKGQYKTETGWSEVVRRTEILKVRKNPLVPETEDVEYVVEETRNGVLINAADGSRYALRWTARVPENQEFEAFFGFNRATDWESFRKAAAAYGGATQNFIYADLKGNIGWQTAGKIPIRRTGSGERIYSGATGEGDWLGYIPFDEMPRLYNPSGGIIMTANQRIVGTSYSYPQMSRDAAMPWRARRIQDLLESKAKLSMDDFRTIQLDPYNYAVHILAKQLEKTSVISDETRAAIKEWDGMMRADSRAALLANEIRNVIASKLAADNKTVLPQILREKLMWWILDKRPAHWLPSGFASYDELIKVADSEAREALAKRYGADESGWVWGRFFQSRFSHPLAAAPLVGAQWATPVVGLDGSGQSPNVGSAVSMSFIASPGNWDSTRLVIPLGQSGDPRSAHWKDQFDLWRSVKPAEFPFSSEAVRREGRTVTVLNPKK
jgi:penicillin G amidase